MLALVLGFSIFGWVGAQQGPITQSLTGVNGARIARLSTPQTIHPTPQPVPITHWLAIRPQDALPWACGLQASAAVLGFIIAARRQRPSSKHGKGQGESQDDP